MSDDSTNTLDLEKARLDPAAVFSTPAALLADERLDRDQKIEILRRWKYDASELAVAEEEGMGGGESSRVEEVVKALEALGAPDSEHSPPTKQQG